MIPMEGSGFGSCLVLAVAVAVVIWCSRPDRGGRA